MAITKKPGRQEIVSAKVTWTFGTGADVTVQGTYPAIDLPANAVVIGGYLNITDATTATVDVSVGDGGSATRYASAVDGAAVALTALTVTGYKYSEPDTIDVTITTADPAAAGTAELVVNYVVDGRAAFSQG